MKKVGILICCTLLTLPVWAQERIRVAVSLDPPQDNNARIIGPTLDALKTKFGSANLEIIRLKLPDLEEAILTNKVDIFLSTSGLSRRMAQKGARDLVTLKSDRLPDPNNAYGTLYIAKADAPYSSLQDMRGSRLAANLVGGFYGYQIGLGELAANGYNPERFFSSISFLGRDLHKVVDAVIAGEADIGSLSSCFLEDNYPTDSTVWQKIKPVALKGSKPCLTSTELFPNWSVSTTPSTSSEISKEVTKALLEMPAAEDGMQWTIATDFTKTDRLFRELKIGPWQFLTTWFQKEFITHYAGWTLLAAVIALLLLLSNYILQKIVRKRTRDLSEALEAQKSLRKAADEANRRLELIQRVSVIEQMGSMIAHELRQPLSVISAYTHAASTRFKNGLISENEALEVLAKVQKQAEKAESIVDRVRSYAKGQDGAKCEMTLKEALEKSYGLFKKSDRFQGDISLSLKQNPKIWGSPLEVEIVIFNLLQNAADALKDASKRDAKICVELFTRDGNAVVRIVNSGPLFTAEDVQNMLNPLYTTNRKGLGLGLPIVTNIVRRHQGRFTLIPNTKGGICAELVFPIIQ
jgi:two-component system sensor histidine kinase TtrS